MTTVTKLWQSHYMYHTAFSLCTKSPNGARTLLDVNQWPMLTKAERLPSSYWS